MLMRTPSHRLNRKSFLVGSVALLSFAALGYFLITNKQHTGGATDVGVTADAVLSITPVSGTYSNGAEFSVDVKLKSTANIVSAAGVTIVYSTDKLEYVSSSTSTPPSIFPRTATPVTINGGNIVFAQYGAEVAATTPQQIMRLTFRVKSSFGIATIAPKSIGGFDPITGIGGSTVINKVSGGAVEIFSSATGSSFTLKPSVSTLKLTVALSGRKPGDLAHSDVRLELLDNTSLPLVPPAKFVSASAADGTVTLLSDTVPALLHLTDVPGVSFKLKVQPLGYLPQTLSVSAASLSGSALTFPLSFSPGAFDGNSDKVQLGDFSNLAAYYTGGVGNAGLLGAFGTRDRVSLLVEFANLSAKFNGL